LLKIDLIVFPVFNPGYPEQDPITFLLFLCFEKCGILLQE
jgi:hypothetical protein